MCKRYLTWEQFQSQDSKQTVVIETESSTKSIYRNGLKYFTRVYLGNFQSREEAWNWCKQMDFRNKVTINKDQLAITHTVRLLRLSKVVREYEQTRPKNTSAILIA